MPDPKAAVLTASSPVPTTADGGRPRKRSCRRGPVLGAALGALTLVLCTANPAGAHSKDYFFNLVAYNGQSTEAAAHFASEHFNNGLITFHSKTEVKVSGHVHDTSYDGWCALASMTVNDGLVGARTVRREVCGLWKGKSAVYTFVDRRVYNVKVAVGLRYPPTGRVIWGKSQKFNNPYW